MASRVEIINGDHEPPFPFVVVDRFGMHVDLSNVDGQLWDPDTCVKVEWGIVDLTGRRFGRVTLKSGQARNFFDPALIAPYVNAWAIEREKRGFGAADPHLTRVRNTQNHA